MRKALERVGSTPGLSDREPHNVIVALVVTAALSGCASLSDIQELRDLPGFRGVNVSQENTFYDRSVRAYRQRGGKNDQEQKVLRGVGGKKIQTEDELARYIEARKREVVGTRTQVTAATFLLFFSPVIISFKVADTVLSFPLRPLISHVEKTYMQEAEKAYTAGRRHFEAGEMDSALAKWEWALMIVMPSLQAVSDVEYWRGRAFEARGQASQARAAYESFLSYSEQSTPVYFKDRYPSDPSWTEKADDAERRIAGLRDRSVPAPESPAR